MFGMLDYRANKLYLLIFGIPLFLIGWSFTLGVPIAAVAIARSYMHSWIGVFCLSFVTLFVLMILQSILGICISKTIEFLFGLMVDVIPDEGRTKEEAKLVVWGGERVIRLLEMNKTEPKNWTDEMIENAYSGFFIFFYKHKIKERCYFLRDYQQNNPEYVANEWNNKKLLKEHGLEVRFDEEIICNPIFRGWAISALLFLYFAIFQPTL